MKKIDLHGKSHEEAMILVNTFIENNIDHLPLQIITGNSNAMKAIVANILKKHNLKSYPKTDYNLGCLIINNI
jgi:DNA-nicking Smr family endonuclease